MVRTKRESRGLRRVVLPHALTHGPFHDLLRRHDTLTHCFTTLQSFSKGTPGAACRVSRAICPTPTWAKTPHDLWLDALGISPPRTPLPLPDGRGKRPNSPIMGHQIRALHDEDGQDRVFSAPGPVPLPPASSRDRKRRSAHRNRPNGMARALVLGGTGGMLMVTRGPVWAEGRPELTTDEDEV